MRCVLIYLCNSPEMRPPTTVIQTFKALGTWLDDIHLPFLQYFKEHLIFTQTLLAARSAITWIPRLEGRPLMPPNPHIRLCPFCRDPHSKYWMICSNGPITSFPLTRTDASNQQQLQLPVWGENRSHSWSKPRLTDDQGKARTHTGNNLLPWGLRKRWFSPDTSFLCQEQT